MKAIRLRTEYLVNPLGIDVQHPRLMWNCEGGVKQSAYQIVTDNWDSGKVETSSMHAFCEIREGLKESRMVPLKATSDVMHILDTVREQIGLVYNELE